MAPTKTTNDPKLDEATRALKLTRPLGLMMPAGSRARLRRLLKTIDEKRARASPGAKAA